MGGLGGALTRHLPLCAAKRKSGIIAGIEAIIIAVETSRDPMRLRFTADLEAEWEQIVSGLDNSNGMYDVQGKSLPSCCRIGS